MYSKFRNRVMFPISSEAGKVIAFTGRTLAADEKAGPKYLNSPETPIYSKGKVLFNLDLAKEWVKKFDYAILVEGQMDCISVYAAGFQNVIASSGTAFTELQAKLLGRFSKNVVVNFDPDTAGAKAAERTIGLLVEEEFDIKVLTLEQGFDPDLYIRRKGKDAYSEALRHSQKYFDYLIERARAQFPVRSAEGKQKAVNHLLPHVQRMPSRIVRDELAQEIAQKLQIDSAVLRQELRHAAATRETSAVKAPAEAQVTDAEKILIRALASARQIQSAGEHLSARDGAEEEFDPARQAQLRPAEREPAPRPRHRIARRMSAQCRARSCRCSGGTSHRSGSPSAGLDPAKGGRRTHRGSSRSRGPRAAPHSLAPPPGSRATGIEEARAIHRQRSSARITN